MRLSEGKNKDSERSGYGIFVPDAQKNGKQKHLMRTK
jgi:hypothetical protein